MSAPEKRKNRVVGDDGELLQGDVTANQRDYQRYADDVWLANADDEVQQPRPRRNNRTVNQVVGIFVALAFVAVVVESMTRPHSDQPVPVPVPKGVSAESVVFPNFPAVLPPIGDMVTIATSNVQQVAWSPDEHKLAYRSDAGQYIWDWESQNDGFGTPFWATSFAWAPDSDSYAFGAFDRLEIRKLSDWSVRGGLSLVGVVSQLDWSGDEQMLAIVSNEGQKLTIMDSQQYTALYRYDLAMPISDMAWQPSGSALLFVIGGKLWEWHDTRLDVFPTYGDVGWDALDWSPDGLQVVLVGHSGDGVSLHSVLETVDAATHEIMWTTALLDYPVKQVAWSPDGTRIATFASGSREIYTWNSTTGDQRNFLRLPAGATGQSISWSPDGRYLAVGTNLNLTIWSPP